MKTQKLVVIIALVSLITFLNVLSFPQTAQAQPDPAKVSPKLVDNALRAAGYVVDRDGKELKVEEQIVLLVPKTLQDWEDSGIKASLVEPISTEEEGPSQEELKELIAFKQLDDCLNSAQWFSDYKNTRCEFNPTGVGDLFCKTGVFLEDMKESLECIFTYLQQ